MVRWQTSPSLRLSCDCSASGALHGDLQALGQRHDGRVSDAQSALARGRMHSQCIAQGAHLELACGGHLVATVRRMLCVAALFGA